MCCYSCYIKWNTNNPNCCASCRTVYPPETIHIIDNNTNTNTNTNTDTSDQKMFISTKNKEILKILGEYPEERFIIFTQFPNFINSLLELLKFKQINTLTYNNFILADKITKDNTQVIILSSNTHSSGIDLSFINNLIITEPFADYLYSKTIEEQIIGRICRITQTKPVNVYKLIIKGTIEEH